MVSTKVIVITCNSEISLCNDFKVCSLCHKTLSPEVDSALFSKSAMLVCFDCISTVKSMFVKKSIKITRIFLGGTCTSDWRKDFIQFLEEERLDYFNPVVDNWTSELIQKEDIEKLHSDYLLFHITPKQQGFYSFAEIVKALYDSDPKKVLFSIQLREGFNEFGTDHIKSLNAIGDLVRYKGGRFFPEGLLDVQSFLRRSNKISNY